MPKFFCRSEVPETQGVPVGSRIQKRYIRSSDLRGKACLEEVGQFDLQDHINSFRDDVDLQKIIARSVGDPSVLQRVQGVYTDISGFPTNVHELHQFIKQAENAFDNLPEDARAGKTFDSFLADIKSLDSLYDFVDLYNQSLTVKSDDQVVSDSVS